MQTQVIETATFKLAEESDETSFRETLAGTLEFAAGCEGFVRRTLSQGPEGWWLDLVEWSSAEAAEAANQKFMSDTRNLPFMNAIDRATLTMRHAELVVERT